MQNVHLQSKRYFFILKGNIFYFGFVVKIFVFRYSTESEWRVQTIILNILSTNII